MMFIASLVASSSFGHFPRRAEAAMDGIRASMSLQGNIVFANGLGERLADEYFQLPDDTRNANFRGVACYLWESFSTARDPFLRLSVAFATPPTGGSALNRRFLSALHMGRHRAQPRSTFA
jgi:hypothetical protein